MKRMIGKMRKNSIEGNKIMKMDEIGRKDDIVEEKKDLIGKIGRNKRRMKNGLKNEIMRGKRRKIGMIEVNKRGKKIMIER